MKRIIMVIFITSILSAALFAKGYEYSCEEPYSYFIYNEASLTQEQLAQIIELKSKYQSKIHELRQKIYLEKTKMNLEMAKKNPDNTSINNSMRLNIEYSKELRKIANDFLDEYNKIKNNK